MNIALIQFELHVHGAESLKDKRRVVRSLKAKLHREHLCAVAEIGLLDHRSTARLGVAVLGAGEGAVPRLQGVAAAILRSVRSRPDATLGESAVRIVHADDLPDHPDAAGAEPELWLPEESRLAAEALVDRGIDAELLADAASAPLARVDRDAEPARVSGTRVWLGEGDDR